MFFIESSIASESIATATTQQGFQSFASSLIPLIIFIAIFYFLLIRPQQKKQKQHNADIASLKPNDCVITSGGIYAVVKKIKENRLVVEIAENVEIEVSSSTVNLLQKDKVDSKIVASKKTESKATTSKTEKVAKSSKNSSKNSK